MTIQQYNKLKIGDKIYWKGNQTTYIIHEISSSILKGQPMIKYIDQNGDLNEYYISPSEIDLIEFSYSLKLFL